MTDREVVDVGKIVCIGKDGVTRELFCNYYPNESTPGCQENYVFRVGGLPGRQDNFYILLVHRDEQTLFVKEVHGNEYRGMGIPEMLLPLLSAVLAKKIASSSCKFGNYDNEKRSENGDKMWRRLMSLQLAYYDEVSDRYFLWTTSDRTKSCD